MRIASRVKWFLDSHKIDYEVIHHPEGDSFKSLLSGARHAIFSRPN